MVERLSPGIFIQERQSGATVITPVSTSNFATVGFTRRGVINRATLVTSLEDFFNKFGGFTSKSQLPIAMTAFFNNGGARSYVVRVAPSDAVVATGSIGSYWDWEAKGPGADYNRVRTILRGNENSKTIATATYTRFDVDVLEESENGEGDFELIATYEDLSLTDEDDARYIETIIDNSDELVNIDASAGGIPSQFDSTQVTGESVGTGDDSTQTFTDTLSNTRVAENTLKINNNGTEVGADNGTGLINAVDSSGVTGTIDYDTGDLTLFFSTPPAGGNTITADYYQAGVSGITTDLTGGADGTFPLGRSDLTNPALEADKEGLYALNDVEEILNLGIMETAGDIAMMGDQITYAARRKDIFAILAPAASLTPQQVLNFKRAELASLSSYAALYYPHITIADPLRDGASKNVPPIGHIAGILARTDTQRNVGEAPAGVEKGALNFAIGLERVLSKGERDLIYPANINPLISSPQTGRAVWGSRLLATTGDFTQIGVRRLFIFLEKSVFNSTHDFVFETIGNALFASITGRISGFLNTLFLQNYFAGSTPEESFFVICNESNNPASIQASRTVICDIGVAAQEPAEFIVFRFQRKLAE